MTEDDGKLTRRYRELAREEPPAAMDAAILAASRRAVKSRPASQRWAGPVSIAAVLMLAVGVTLNLQREEPGIEVSEPAARVAIPENLKKSEAPATADALSTTAASAPPAAMDKAAPPRKAEPAPQPALEPKLRADRSLRKEFVPSPPAAASGAGVAATQAAPSRVEGYRMESRPFADSNAADAREQAATVHAPASPAAASPPSAAALSRQREEPQLRAKKEAAGAAPSPSQKSLGFPLPDPAAELERIARLRADSRHEEADKALADFQRANPGYRIPDAVWDRVKPR